jgi:hypothetical protein
MNETTTTNTQLSPAAQAVLDAAFAQDHRHDHPSLAAALRAAADQVVPKGSYVHIYFHTATIKHIYLNLLAIAAELEGAN